MGQQSHRHAPVGFPMVIVAALKRPVSLVLFLVGLLGIASQAFAQGGVSYLYDDLGRLARVIDASGQCADYTYDAVGNVVSINTSASCGSAPVVTGITATSNACYVAAGSNLLGASVAADLASVTVTGLRATSTAVTFCLKPQTQTCSAAVSGTVTIATPGGSTGALPVTLAPPPALVSGVPQSGTIDFPGQARQYCLQAPSLGRRIVQATSSAVSTCLQVSDTNNQLVAGGLACGPVSVDVTPMLSAGTYVLEVAGQNSGTGRYDLLYEPYNGQTFMPSAVTVGAWLQTSVQTAFLEAGAHGGVTATITSSDPTRVRVAPNATTAGTASITVAVPDGQTLVSWVVQGVEGTTGTANISVTTPGFASGTPQVVTVVPSGVELQGLPTTMTSLDATNTGWYALVGIPNAQGTTLQQYQDVRVGGPAFVVSVSNSTAAVATLTSDEPVASGQTVTKPIRPGVYYTQAILLGSGAGFTFDPVGVGTTTVSVTGPAGVPTMTVAGARTVTVSGPQTFMPSAVTVGAWLQTGLQVASLEAGAHGGVTATITSSDPTRVRVAPDATTPGTASIAVTVPDGQTTFSWVVQGVEGTTGTASISVTTPGFSSGTPQVVTVVPIGVELQGLPTTMTSLDPTNTGWYALVGIPNAQGTTLQQYQNVRVGGPAFVVTVSNSTAAVATLTSDEPVASGQTVTKPIRPGVYYTQAILPGSGAGFTFDPVGVGTTTVSVTGPAGVPTMTIGGARTVTVSGPQTFMPAPVTVGAWLQTSVQTAFLESGAHGGLTATITSSDPTRVRVAPDATTAGTASIAVAVPNGQTYISWVVQGVEGTTGTASISVSTPGFSSGTPQVVTVVPIGVELQGLPTTMTSLDPTNTGWYALVGIPNALGTTLQQYQNVRMGGPAFVVAVSNSTATVATLTSDEPVASGQTVTKPIQPGVYYTQAVLPGSGAGFTFDPVGVGTTTVTVTGPPGVAAMTMAGARTVTVSGPQTVMPSAVTVGAWLQTSVQTAFLEAGAHGGVTATITSSDPTRVRVAPNATTAGTASITVAVPDGQTLVSWVVQGVEGTTGTANISVTTPGFASGTPQVVTVVPSGVELQGLPTTMTSLDATNTGWYALVGIPNAQGTTLQQYQDVRVGGPAFVVSVSNSTAAVATLTSDEPVASGQTVTKPIRPGVYYTQALLPGSGAGFTLDPIGVGTTTVTVMGPPGVAAMTASGARTVTVSGPQTFMPTAVTVGAWLQTGLQVASLEAGAHGGVTATITSSDPTRVRVAPDATTPGTASIAVTVPDGQTTFSWVVQGVEGTTGTASISVTTPGFSSGPPQVVTVVPIGVELQGLPTTMTSLDPTNTGWYALVGIPNALGTALQQYQNVRAGGPVFVVSVSNSTAAVATLTSDEPVASGQTVTKPIQSGVYYTQAVLPGSGAGFTFDPVGVGTTTVSVTGPAGVPTMTIGGARSVTVNGPQTFMPSAVTVGAWLQTGLQVASLEAGAHGGVTATITSTDPTRVRVAPDSTTPGTASITVTVPDGQTSFAWVVQGVEGTTGTASISVTTPGFASGPPQVVTVVPIGVELQGLPVSMTPLDPPATGLYAMVGIPDALGTQLQQVQGLRAGGPAFLVSVSNSTAAVATLTSDEPVASGQTVTKPFQPGFYYTQAISPGSSAGLTFTPLAPGTTTVTVTGPAGVPTMTIGGARLVTVSP